MIGKNILKINPKIRMFVLIGLIFIMNLFDLYLTMFFIKYFDFEELNPLAKIAAEKDTESLIFFKLILVSFSLSVLCYCYNKSKMSLYSCWFLISVFFGLMIYWAAFLKIFNDSMGF